MITVGTHNENNRIAWLKMTLASIPAGQRILDAGAGEQQFKRFCSHLDYIAQDFAKYDGKGDNRGLQMSAWDQSSLHLVCDISSIPEPDGSFDVIMCTEVLEHLPEPILALREFSRLLKTDGLLVVTAPFCSLTHFAPYHFTSGYNSYFYQKHLGEMGFEILELTANGNYIEFLAQELHRLSWVAKKYCDVKMNCLQRVIISLALRVLQRLSLLDRSSSELLCFGYHVLARKKPCAAHVP